MSARREFLIGLGAALAWSLPARAQLPRTMYRIGFLGNTTAALEANLIEPFRQGLRDLGGNYPVDVPHRYIQLDGYCERDDLAQVDSARTSVREIEITPKMVRAGEAALERGRGVCSDDAIVREVYIAMRRAERDED